MMSPDYEDPTREYLDGVSRFVYEIDADAIERLAALLAEAVARGHVILVAGNGGSLATVSHLAVDLEKCIQAELPIERRRHPHVPRIHILNGNASLMSAWANDDAWANAIAWQTGAWGESGSVLLLLSASGNSQNLLQAARVGRNNGLTVAALVGRTESRLASAAHILIEVGTHDVQIAEDTQSVMCHALFRALKRRLLCEGNGG